MKGNLQVILAVCLFIHAPLLAQKDRVVAYHSFLEGKLSKRSEPAVISDQTHDDLLDSDFIKTGETLLEYAVIYSDTECARLLIESGADPRIKNNYDYSAYDYAKKEKFKELIDLMNTVKTRK